MSGIPVMTRSMLMIYGSGGAMTTQELDAIRGRLGRLERENRLWRWGALIVGLGVIAAVVPGGDRDRVEAAQGEQDQPVVEEPTDPEVVYEQLHRISERAIEMVEGSIRQRAMVRNVSEEVTRWAYLLLEMDIYRIPLDDGTRTVDPELHLVLSDGPQDPARVEAFRSYRDRLRFWEERFRPLARDGTLSDLRFMELQARRMMAEGWLARELRKPSPP